MADGEEALSRARGESPAALGLGHQANFRCSSAPLLARNQSSFRIASTPPSTLRGLISSKLRRGLAPSHLATVQFSAVRWVPLCGCITGITPRPSESIHPRKLFLPFDLRRRADQALSARLGEEERQFLPDPPAAPH